MPTPPKPSMWNKYIFVAKTTPPFGRSSLTQLDRALELWDSHKGKSDSYSNHVVYLLSVIQECKNWKQAKSHKLATNPTSNLQKRMNAVDELIRQAFARLRWEVFAASKQRGAKPNTVSLGGGYSNERVLFEKEKAAVKKKSTAVINPKGGSFVHESMQGATPQMIAAAQVNVPGDIATLLNKPFGSLSDLEFGRLHDWFNKNNLFAMQRPNVHYVRKDERISQYMLIVINGLFYRDQAEQPYSTNGLDMYALDRYGNFICTSSNTFYSESAQFNHSSLNAGRDVICAGTCKFQNGLLTYIDNQSGHYKPTRANLHQAIQCLVDDHRVDLRQDSLDHGDRCAAIVYELSDLLRERERRRCGTASGVPALSRARVRGAAIECVG